MLCLLIVLIVLQSGKPAGNTIDEILTQCSAAEITDKFFKGNKSSLGPLDLAELALRTGRIGDAKTYILKAGTADYKRNAIVRYMIEEYTLDDIAINYLDKEKYDFLSVRSDDNLLSGLAMKIINGTYPIYWLENAVACQGTNIIRQTDLLDALELLARCHASNGEFEKANKVYRRFDEEVSHKCAPGSIYNSKKYLLLSEIALREGDYMLSWALLDSAETHIKAHGNNSIPAYADLLVRRADIGNATGRYDEARTFLRKAEALYKVMGADNSGIMVMSKVVDSYILQGRLKEGMALCDSLEENSDKTVAMFGQYIKITSNMGELSILDGLPSAAVLYYDLAWDLYKSMEMSDMESGLRLLAGAGYACVSDDKEDKAIEFFREQLDKERSVAHDEFVFMPEGKRGRYWAHADTRMRRLFSVNREGSLTLKVGKVVDMPSHNKNMTSELLFDASLFYKGLLLESSAALRRALSGRNGIVSGEVKRLDSLRDIIASRPNPDAALVASADDLEKKLLREVPELSGFMDFMSIDWRRIRDALKSDELAVEFVCSTDGGVDYYSAELLRHDWDKPKHIFLFSAKEGKPVFDSHDYCDNPSIYRRLWRKIEPFLTHGGRVYFAAAGYLHNTPIEYALLPDGTRFNDRYRAERVSSCRRIIHHRAAAGDMIATVYGGLNYNADPDEKDFYAAEAEERLFSMRGADFDGMAEVNWSYLPGTREEARIIEKAMKGAGYSVTLFEGDEGVEESFKKLSGLGLRIIHVATHGFFNPAPLRRSNFIASAYEEDDASLYRCGLVMSGANMPVSGGDDGILTAKEIATLDLYGTDLVVLSACGTGMGRISGDGVFGLQRAFKLAGVESVLMSLWPVHDEATAMLMNEFYSALASGKDKRSALREAQKAIGKAQFTVEEGVLSGSDPRFWAAFILLD